MIGGDGGKWLRKTAMVLSANTYTPVSYWLSIPLRQLGEWIRANNELIEEAKNKK